MNDEICYNIAAALLIIIIFSALLCRKMIKGNINKAFIYLVFFTFISILINMFSIAIDGDPKYTQSLKLFISIAYYIFRNLSFGAYTIFIIAVTDTGHIMGKGIARISLAVPMVITCLLAVSTLFSHHVFYIDRSGYFVRGRGIGLIYLCSAVYCVYSVVIVHIFRISLGRNKCIALISCAVGALAAYIIGLSYPYLHIDLICYSIGILFIMLIVQNPELSIDSQSGLLRHATYFSDVKNSFYTKKQIAIIQINIAHFNQISNMLSYGKLGKFILRISKRLEVMCRRLNLSCEIYYLKEGKFRVILDPESKKDAEKAAKAFCNIFNTSEKYADINMELKSTICITRCPEDIDNFDNLYDFETSLDKCETTGEVIGAVSLLSDNEYNLTSHIGEIIDRGIRENKFEVFYQPIYNMKTRKFDSAEALLRLYDDKFGEIPPSVFIPVAEKDGSIYKLGQFVIEEVCSFISEKDFSKHGIRNIGVNLSGIQCLKGDMAKDILSTIKSYGVDPEIICFEVTESQATESQRAFIDNINALVEGGARICLDEFGAAYSNIQNVSSLPFYAIKFDKSFANTGKDSKQEVILRNSIDMVRNIGKKIVVEGVETEELFRKFDFLECDYIQGFYFSKAVPKEQLKFFIAEYQYEI